MSKEAEELANNLDCLTRLNGGGQPVLLKHKAAALIDAAFAKVREECAEAASEKIRSQRTGTLNKYMAAQLASSAILGTGDKL